jgi:hypothetical protein
VFEWEVAHNDYLYKIVVNRGGSITIEEHVTGYPFAVQSVTIAAPVAEHVIQRLMSAVQTAREEAK